VSSLGNYGDQDDSLYEEQEIQEAAEIEDAEEEGSPINLGQERRKYVVFIETRACRYHQLY